MPFQPGNTLAVGVPHPTAGRYPKKAYQELEKTKQIVLRMLRKDIKKIGKTYIELASGEGREVDPPTTRHAIERLIPQARQEIDLRAAIAIVEVSSFDPDAVDK